MSFYNISQIPERTQIAKHFHSSLEEPNLDNVQAQLYVTRQKNYDLAMQYFKNKYGNAHAYETYIKQNNLEGLGPPPAPPQMDFKQHLERKAYQIQQEELRKIQQKKKLPNYDEDKHQEKSKKNHNNPWHNTKQPSPKNREIQKQDEYSINIINQKQNQYVSEFKNYLNNKKKHDLKDLPVDESINISGSKFYRGNASVSPKKHQIQQSSYPDPIINPSLKKEQKKSYEEELVKKIFRDIKGSGDLKFSVEKLNLIEYLIANKKILKVLGVGNEDITEKIMKYDTKDKNCMNFNELLLFIYRQVGKQEQIKKILAKKQFQIIPTGCMLSDDLMKLFQTSFKKMDKHSDLIVKRVPFINKLAQDPLVKKSLNSPAVFEPEYNKHLSLRRIFQRIQIEYLLGSEQEQKTNEYISWNQFIIHFQSGHKERSKYDLIVLLQSLRNQQKFGLNELPDPVAQIISESFKKVDKGQQFFNTLELINEIKLHREYQMEKYTYVRSDSKESELTSQTLDQLLTRVKEHGQKYVSAKQFLEYFSAKGKPVEELQLKKFNDVSKLYAGAKVQLRKNEILDEKSEEVEGYDSDPQIYNNSKVGNGNGNISNMRKSQRQINKFYQTTKSLLDYSKKQDQHKQLHSNNLKITIPQPFAFEEREKLRENSKNKLNKSVNELELRQKTAFKAKQIPKKVAEVGLYDKMVEDDRKRVEQRKKSTMLMTLANEKPFSFQNRKVQKKTKHQREEFLFKAKPIPWYCSVDLLAKKKQEELIRNEKIAKMAQQNLAKAKLPPRMEKDFLEKEAKKILEMSSAKKESKTVNKVKEPPNFQKIHKELEEALERKRKQNKVTEIKQFKFSQAKPSQSKNKKQQAQQFVKEAFKSAIPPHPKYLFAQNRSAIDIFANSTTKFTQQVEKRRLQIEEKRKKDEIQKKKDEERMKIDEELKKKVQDAVFKNKENKQKEAQQRRKSQNQAQQKQFKQWKDERIQKGRQQPLLVERISKRDEKMDKMKKLYAISQTLKGNGIKGKQHDIYFKREQLLLLQDYEVLKGQLPS